jgi:hypothetical protein
MENSMPENNIEQTVALIGAGAPAAKKPVAGKVAAGKAPSAEPAAVSKPPVVKPAAAKPATKPSRLDETKARNKKALADALAKAQAVKLAKPPSPPPAVKAKVAKAVKGRKPKLVRHAFSMPEVEYAQITTLKKRIASLGGNVKRSELLRAGLALLSVLNDVELTAVMARVDRIKTGRPAKKG